MTEVSKDTSNSLGSGCGFFGSKADMGAGESNIGNSSITHTPMFCATHIIKVQVNRIAHCTSHFTLLDPPLDMMPTQEHPPSIFEIESHPLCLTSHDTS